MIKPFKLNYSTFTWRGEHCFRISIERCDYKIEFPINTVRAKKGDASVLDACYELLQSAYAYGLTRDQIDMDDFFDKIGGKENEKG